LIHPTRFFYRVVDADFEFFADASAIDHLILYQSGRKSKGAKQ
jgi:hypothetical protein